MNADQTDLNCVAQALLPVLGELV